MQDNKISKLKTTNHIPSHGIPIPINLGLLKWYGSSNHLLKVFQINSKTSWKSPPSSHYHGRLLQVAAVLSCYYPWTAQTPYLGPPCSSFAWMLHQKIQGTSQASRTRRTTLTSSKEQAQEGRIQRVLYSIVGVYKGSM